MHAEKCTAKFKKLPLSSQATENSITSKQTTASQSHATPLLRCGLEWHFSICPRQRVEFVSFSSIKYWTRFNIELRNNKVIKDIKSTGISTYCNDRQQKNRSTTTKYKNKWAVTIFNEWQTARKVQVPVLDSGGMFKDYDLPKVGVLLTRIEDVDGLSLNYRLSKFVMEVAKKSGERYPPKTVYGIVCGSWRYLEEKNGAEGLNPRDNYDKR